MPSSTPKRPSPSQRRPASNPQLDELLRELSIKPPGRTSYEVVSLWAAKHVWRIDVDNKPWAYVRYLLGTAEQFPGRWRHLQMGQLLNEVRVGPRILGMSPESQALGGRAVIVEAGLNPISREELEARAPEAVNLIARLHNAEPVFNALAGSLTDDDLSAFRPLATKMVELRERWSAVTHRWLEYDIPHIDDLIDVVQGVLERLVEIIDDDSPVGEIVPAHNDLNAGNFMVNSRGSLRMIDFEELSLSTPVADLGIFLTWYVDKDQHRTMLDHYPLGDSDAILDQMRVWVPIRYLNVAAHWSARLIRAEDRVDWEHAVERIVEWLEGACELTFEGTVPGDYRVVLNEMADTLMEMAPEE